MESGERSGVWCEATWGKREDRRQAPAEAIEEIAGESQSSRLKSDEGRARDAERAHAGGKAAREGEAGGRAARQSAPACARMSTTEACGRDCAGSRSTATAPVLRLATRTTGSEASQAALLQTSRRAT
eukprot:118626-Rhodomonas_salina.1